MGFIAFIKTSYSVPPCSSSLHLKRTVSLLLSLVSQPTSRRPTKPCTCFVRSILLQLRMEGLRGGESGLAPGHGEDHESRPLRGQAGCTLSRRSVTNTV